MRLSTHPSTAAAAALPTDDPPWRTSVRGMFRTEVRAAVCRRSGMRRTAHAIVVFRLRLRHP